MICFSESCGFSDSVVRRNSDHEISFWGKLMRFKKYNIEGTIITWHGGGIVPKAIRDYLEAHGCDWRANEDKDAYWKLRSELLSKIEIKELEDPLRNKIIEQMTQWNIAELTEFNQAFQSLIGEKAKNRKTIVKYLVFSDQDPNTGGEKKDFREPYSLELEDNEIIFSFFNEYLTSSGDVVVELMNGGEFYNITIFDAESKNAIHHIENVILEEGSLLSAPLEKKYTVDSTEENKWTLRKMKKERTRSKNH